MLPVDAFVFGDVGAVGADCGELTMGEGRDGGAEAAWLLSGDVPGLARVVGVDRDVRGVGGLEVVAADCDKQIGALAGDAENAAGGVAAGDGSFGDGPGLAGIGRVEDARFRAAGREVNAGVAKGDGGAAGSEGAFFGERGGHAVAREFIPMVAVVGAQDEEFAVNGIAERDTVSARGAGEGVEKKAGALVGVLQLPGFASVDGFVDAGFGAVADGEDVGNVGVERFDIAEVEIGGAGDGELRPCCAAVDGAKNHAFRAGSPDGVALATFAGADGFYADTAEVGIDAFGLDGPPRFGIRGNCQQTEQ